MATKDIKELQKLLNKGMKVMPEKLPKIIEVEGLQFIEKNFRDEGFNDGSLKKWKKRKTRDSGGRDLTRYRTNRVGRKGNLNRYGSKVKDRALLVGHATGGDKLKNSFRARRNSRQVRFITYKGYARRHNEGLKGMPQRQFMGQSKTLTQQIEKKLTKELDKIFK
ncbi:phage morphogenesis protein [Zunongwangia profunda]|mgnify:CR=1 FL=1|uniref:phage morphogenesis protein n=1 Tax=Zunongwangia profunda TaxID=398743 RepID=UPI00248DF2DB|nr:phage morphogenesis protein [Zunongwangia profunda]|tara:strand:- start:14816 stop:15310 length:495 start_codon:yes stop_codon:yes gene_type:complete